MAYYNKWYQVYFPELREHQVVRFEFLAKVDFDPFGSHFTNK
jgi:hypothetical protein